MAKKKTRRPPVGVRLARAEARAERWQRVADELEDHLSKLKKPQRSKKYKEFQRAFRLYEKAKAEADVLLTRAESAKKAAHSRLRKKYAKESDVTLFKFDLTKGDVEELVTWEDVEEITKRARNEADINRDLRRILRRLFDKIGAWLDRYSSPSKIRGWATGAEGKISVSADPNKPKWRSIGHPVQRPYEKSRRRALEFGFDDISDMATGKRVNRLSGHYYQFRLTRLYVYALSEKGGF